MSSEAKRLRRLGQAGWIALLFHFCKLFVFYPTPTTPTPCKVLLPPELEALQMSAGSQQWDTRPARNALHFGSLPAHPSSHEGVCEQNTDGVVSRVGHRPGHGPTSSRRHGWLFSFGALDRRSDHRGTESECCIRRRLTSAHRGRQALPQALHGVRSGGCCRACTAATGPGKSRRSHRSRTDPCGAVSRRRASVMLYER